MKNYLLLIFISLAIKGYAQDIHFLDNSYGFRGVKFESSITEHPTMQPIFVTEDSAYISYRRSDENFSIDGAKVDIVYTFYKNQLSTVYIQTIDSMGSRIVLKALQKDYGKGKKEDPYIEKYMWYGTKVMMSYMEDINRFEAKIFMSSIRMKLKSEGR